MRALPHKNIKIDLIELFLQKGEWSDYEKIKSHCSSENRRKQLDEIIQRGRDSKFGWRIPIIEIYLKERIYEKALKEVLERKSLHTLSEYQKNLADIVMRIENYIIHSTRIHDFI